MQDASCRRLNELIPLLLVATLCSVSVFAWPRQQPEQKPRQSLGSSNPASDRIAREVRHELLFLHCTNEPGGFHQGTPVDGAGPSSYT
jgi:hypothetical protein